MYCSFPSLNTIPEIIVDVWDKEDKGYVYNIEHN